MTLVTVSAGALPFLPEQDSYRYSNNSGVVAANTAGGLSRVRKDFEGGGSIVSCTYVLTAAEFEVFMLFYDVIAKRGAVQFNAPLILHDNLTTEYPCYFVPNTLQVSGPNGSRSVVTVDLEVDNPVDAALDSSDYDTALAALS